MMGYGFGMMGFFWMIIPLALIGLIIYALVRLFSNGQRRNNGFMETNSALDILNERYARGEMSDEEYEKKKKILRG